VLVRWLPAFTPSRPAALLQKPARQSQKTAPFDFPGGHPHTLRSGGVTGTALHTGTAGPGQGQLGKSGRPGAFKEGAAVVGFMAVVGRGSVALDTVAVIYFIEEHPLFLPLIGPHL
jgi:hypothetical protein